MATRKQTIKSKGAVQDFLADDTKTILTLTREELAELDEELTVAQGEKEHWLKTMVETRLRGLVSG